MLACTPDMAYEALASLQQALQQILKRHDNLCTEIVKTEITSIHDQAAVLQLNLINDFPETIREVASTTHDIVEYLFSPENLSDCGSTEPSVNLSKQLRELAEELESTAGDVVGYFTEQLQGYSPAVSSSSRSALATKDEDPTVSVELTVRLSNRLRKLANNFLSTPRALADDVVVAVAGIDEALSYSPAVSSSSTSEDGVVGFDEDVEQIMDPAVSSSSRRLALTSKDVVVGFDEDVERIMDRHIFGSSLELQVLSIVGMGGIGKSILAKFVYDHALVVDHFDIRGWVTVSQDYSVESVHLNLLASIKGKLDRAGRYSPRGEEIRKCLYSRRYLIVMDDVWSLDAWKEISRVFPDDVNGSRIILTTKVWNLAEHVSSQMHMVKSLDDQQSWNLFKRKVFADQTCPPELQGVGKKIVQNCGGLPLSIVTVAGLLSRIGRTPKFWEQVVATDGQLESILSLSYIHLPPHLKSCFLYMAAFPENYEIRVSELIKLWVAEGFLQKHSTEAKSLEETAQEFLEDLIVQSLVLATRSKIDGNIKSCRLHTTVRDFCVREAGQKKFLVPVMDYLPSPILRRHFLPQVLQNYRRISVSWCDLELKDSMHSSCTHSIICIPQKGYRPKGSVRNFSSLRVLHVLRRNDHSYWELGQVFDLIHLTYLASNIPTSIVPPAISKLQNLQTLIIYRSGVHLPVEIWRMRQLRHLMAFSFDPLPHPEAAALPLENLHTLSLVTNFVCSGRMVEMIPNIQKLGICCSGEKFDEGYHLDNLKHLLRLEILKWEMCSSSSSSFRPSFRPVLPLTLKKLSLSGCRFPWRDMKIVGSLPNLQVLKLRNYACDGEHWETAQGEFRQLRVLLIGESNLHHWATESSHFPVLKCLMLHGCPYLSEIPSEIGDIPTLELIEADDHKPSLYHSARMIQEEQKKYGNEDLKVRLKRF